MILKKINKINILLFSVVIFFILFKFYIINLTWIGRFLPPEPDDSFSYIAGIRLIGDSGSYLVDLKYILPWNNNDHIIYLPWKTLLAIVSVLGNFSYVDVYKVNFYFGTVLMSLTIIYMLKVFEKDKLFWIISISFLTFYTGSGEYHGFFWVVPSFFSVIASFLLISLVYETEENIDVSEKKMFMLIFIITFLTVWSHPLGKYSYIAIVFSYIIYILLKYTLFSGKSLKFLIRKCLVLIFCGSFAIFSSDLLPYLLGVIPSSVHSLPGSLLQIMSKPSSYELFRELYLDKFSFNSPYTILLILGLFALLFNKKLSLLTIYFGFLIFTFTTSFFGNYAYRMLVYLWPFTFIIFSYGCYFLIQRFIEISKTGSDTEMKIEFDIIGTYKKIRIKKNVLLLAVIIVLISVNYIFPFILGKYNWSISYAKYRRNRMDWKMDEKIVSYLHNMTNPGDLLIYEDTNAFMTLTSLGLLDRKAAYANWEWSKQSPISARAEKVNGTYLIATDGLDRSLIFNLMEAFEGKLAFYPIRNFGILRIYRLIVRQTESPYFCIDEGFDIKLVAEDNQTSFWSKTKDLTLIDNNDIKTSGENSLNIIVSQTKKGQNDYFWHTYETVQDWSKKDKLVFDWNGTGDNKRIEILIYAPDSQNRFDFEFKNDFNGWNRMIFLFKDAFIRIGNPKWSNVKSVYFRFSHDGPYNETYFLDRLALDVNPAESEKYVELMTDDAPTTILILLYFSVIVFPLGLMWVYYVFRVRDFISLLALSFGISFSLLFPIMFILNIFCGIAISKTLFSLTIFVFTLFPLIVCTLKRNEK